MCVCPVDLENRNERILISREEDAAQGAGRYKPTSSGFQKQLRSHGTHYINSSGTTAPALQSLVFVTATVLLCWYVCAQSSPEDTVGTCNHDHICICMKWPFFAESKSLSPGRGSFLALSAAGHAGGPPPVHPGATVGRCQAPWRVLWVFKVAKSGK